jgi:hypothetical protein
VPDLISAYLDAFGRWNSAIDPVAFLDPAWTFGVPSKTIDAVYRESVTRFFGMPLGQITPEHIMRFAEVSPDRLDLQIVPHSPELWNSLLNPLRLAKKAYALGDYIVTIALAGMVAEMLTLVTFEVHGPIAVPKGAARGRVMSFEEFEKQVQEKRIDALRSLLMPERVAEFTLIRKVRREYLHFWTKKHGRIREDARDCFLGAMSLFREFLNPGIQGTAVTFDPKVIAAVKRWQGIF